MLLPLSNIVIMRAELLCPSAQHFRDQRALFPFWHMCASAFEVRKPSTETGRVRAKLHICIFLQTKQLPTGGKQLKTTWRHAQKKNQQCRVASPLVSVAGSQISGSVADLAASGRHCALAVVLPSNWCEGKRRNDGSA